ncbi:DEAD/DEAH box helicase [Bernardetia sp.]|uniref:DEAD/DEAH box helicase n=1 Tax=Bernardetia sp. TaxID=1937974 RepID=UPI0025B90758|nr:DEAD/DEAH box helicase [Bernardetia sp.]
MSENNNNKTISFADLGLSDELLQAVEKQGYTSPSSIQEKVIPHVLDKKDVLASAQTGTGKTAGFTLPMLQLLTQNEKRRSKIRRRVLRCLILTPTRELAAQVFENVQAYSEFLDIRSAVIFGGVNQNPQIRTLKNGVDVLIATPGRLLDLENQKALSLADVEILVLDEADRMLDMGFVHDIKRVIKLVPTKRQNLLFSATFSKEIKELAGKILTNHVTVEATPENTTVEKINQVVYSVNKTRKSDLIIQLIDEGNWEQVLVFTRTKYGANRLSDKMNKKGIKAAPIHGNKTQNARTKALQGFKDGEIRVLVATDIAARGLDIPLLPYVINYELPNVAEDYVHRIGRTGRAGAGGDAISLVSHDEVEFLKNIERLVKEEIEVKIAEGFEPTAPTKEDIEEAELAARQMSGRAGAYKKNRQRNRTQGEKGKSNSVNLGRPKSKTKGRRSNNPKFRKR